MFAAVQVPVHLVVCVTHPAPGACCKETAEQICFRKPSTNHVSTLLTGYGRYPSFLRVPPLLVISMVGNSGLGVCMYVCIYVDLVRGLEERKPFAVRRSSSLTMPLVHGFGQVVY